MRLLITIPEMTLDYGGPSLSALRTAQSVAARGVEVAIAHGLEGEARPADGTRLLPIEDDGYRGYARRLTATARKFRPDVIYDFGVWRPRNAASARVAKQLGIPWINSPRGMLEPWSLSSKRFKKKIAWTLYQRRLLESAAALIATSVEEQANLRRLLPRAAVHLAPNGVDIPELPLDRTAAGAHQALYLSRLDPKKQPDLLIRAWGALRPAGWRLVIAGPGDAGYREQLHELVREHQLVGNVEIREGMFGSNKDQLLFGSHLFVLPTFSENFGIAIAEALAHALPVITTTGTPWGEIARGGSGWIVPPEEEAVKHAMSKAFALSAADLAAMGLRGRELARNYSWDRTAQCVLDICAGALKR